MLRRSWGRAIWCPAWWTTEATSATTSVTSTSPRWPASSSVTTGWSAASWISAAKTSTLCTVAASALERRWGASFIYYQTWTTTKQNVSVSLITWVRAACRNIWGRKSGFSQACGFSVYFLLCLIMEKLRCKGRMFPRFDCTVQYLRKGMVKCVGWLQVK